MVAIKKKKKKMGRPFHPDKKVKISIYLRSLERERVKVLAKARGVTRTEVVAEILKKNLNAKFHHGTTDLV